MLLSCGVGEDSCLAPGQTPLSPLAGGSTLCPTPAWTTAPVWRKALLGRRDPPSTPSPGGVGDPGLRRSFPTSRPGRSRPRRAGAPGWPWLRVYYSGSKHPNYAPPSGLPLHCASPACPQYQLRQSSFCLLYIPGYIPPPHTQAVPTFPCCTHFHKTISPMGTPKNQFRPHCLQQASPSLHV